MKPSLQPTASACSERPSIPEVAILLRAVDNETEYGWPCRPIGFCGVAGSSHSGYAAWNCAEEGAGASLSRAEDHSCVFSGFWKKITV
jgi:hypothetical protein